MKLIAERMGRFEPTASSVATGKARELAATGRDVIRLSQGEPDFPTPDHVKQAVIFSSYWQSWGNGSRGADTSAAEMALMGFSTLVWLFSWADSAKWDRLGRSVY